MKTAVRVLLAVAVLVGGLALVLRGGRHGTELRFEQGQLFFKPPVTKDEATRLGHELLRLGHFGKDKPQAVQVAKEASRWQLVFVVQAGVERETAAILAHRVLAARLADTVFGRSPVEVSLADRELRTLKSLGVTRGLGEQSEFNAGQVYWLPPATRQEAQRLGRYLVDEGHFDGRPKTVQLAREGGTYQVRCVVAEGGEADPAALAGYLRLREGLATRVFRKAKVELHLADRSLMPVKEVKPAP